jgi:hypothetical protein
MASYLRLLRHWWMMNSLFSPYELEIILWYHSRASDWQYMDAPIWRETINKLIKFDLISQSSVTTYCATEKLHAYVDGLCNLPLPVQKWIIPHE